MACNMKVPFVNLTHPPTTSLIIKITAQNTYLSGSGGKTRYKMMIMIIIMIVMSHLK